MDRIGLKMTLAALAVVGLASGAVAQDHKRPRIQEAEAVAPANQFQAADLLGRDIKALDGEMIGHVVSVAVGVDGSPEAVIVGLGQFREAGAREVAIPWTELLIPLKSSAVTVAMTKDELAALPEYRYADPAQRGSAFRSLSVQTSPLA